MCVHKRIYTHTPSDNLHKRACSYTYADTNTHTYTLIYIYIYMYMCVCVCAHVCALMKFVTRRMCIYTFICVFA